MRKKSVFILLSVCCALGCMAQSLEIVEEFKENKMSTVLTTYKNEFGYREKQHVKDNKFPFAVLEVYLEGDEQAVKAAKSKLSLDLGSHFTIEGVCKTYTNRIVFLISSSVRNVYMTCGDGCKEQVIFSGQTLEQNKIYYGRVKYTPAKVTTISENQEPLKKQYFKFRIHPADVAGITVLVTENGQQEPWNVAEGIASKKMDYGVYHYVISADRYHKTEGSFTVSDTNNELDIQLRPQFGWLNVSGDNSAHGAYVFATNHSTGNVKQIGTIPLQNTELNAGAYSLRIQKTKYKDYLTTIQIEEGDTTTIRPVLEANFAQLTLAVQNGAEIWLDDNRLGTTSWTGTLELGEYTLEARQANHRSNYTQVVVSEQSVGKTIQLNNPKPIYGTFEVSGSPADAMVYVDGKKAGTTPLVVNNVLVGAHKIRIEKEGYDIQEKSVQLAEGQETAVAYTLTKTVKPVLNNTPTTYNDLKNGEEKGVAVPKFPNEKIKIGSLYYTATDDGTSVKVAKVPYFKKYYQFKKIAVPAEISYKGYKYSVTSIGNGAFEYCRSLTSIIIPNSVTSIGDKAFEGCKNLASITIPNNVTIIGDKAFSGTPWYTNFEKAKDVVYIGKVLYEYYGNPSKVIVKNGTFSINPHAFENCHSLSEIILPNSVMSIGEGAFLGCDNLTSISLPNSVTSIGDKAFSFCEKLTSITIPNSVTSIGKAAFDGCGNLTSITIPNSVTSIGDKAFSRCRNLTSITIPNSVTSIGYSAFSGCNNLTSITIPNGVTSIGKGAFDWCTSLTSITIPNGVTSIGDGAFSRCRNLTSITIPNSVTSIGNSAFYDCDKLTSITIPNSVTSIGNSAFKDCENLTSITIPNSVTSIGERAFDGCENLTSITIPPNCVMSIGDYAFAYFRNLTSFTIPNSVTSIGKWAFVGCWHLSSITIPNGVTSIGKGAFDWCTRLTFITIPNSVTSIGGCAFRGCGNLTSIKVDRGNPKYDSRNNCNAIIETATNTIIAGCSNTIIPYSVTSIGEYAFFGSNKLTSITILNSITSIGNGAFGGCNNLTSIIVDKNNPIYDSRNNCNAIIETATNTLIAGCSNTIIPNSVTSIGNSAFEYCNKLKSITIPNSVTSIGNSAFYDCENLTSITIPNSVTSIGNSAFYDCDKLTSITIPNSVTSIGNSAFKDCENLTSITIPNSVTSIGNSAFEDCEKLTSITIPNSVTSIGEEAFEWCYNLKKIYIPRGTKAKFAAMEGLKKHVGKLVER